MTTDKSMNPDIRYSQTEAKLYVYDPDRTAGWGNNDNLPGRELEVPVINAHEVNKLKRQVESQSVLIHDLMIRCGILIGITVGLGSLVLWMVVA